MDTVAFSFSYTAAGPPPDTSPYLARVFLKMNEKLEPMLVACLSATLGLVALTRWSFARKHGGVPLVVAASAAVSLFATSVGGRYFGHYYLFFLPTFVLLCASGAAWVGDLVGPSRRWSAVALACVPLSLVKDAGAIEALVSHAAPAAQRWEGHWLSDVLRRNTTPGDLIWTPWNPLLYVEAHRLSPTKWHNVFDQNFDRPPTTTAQKFTALRADLASHPPEAILVSPLPGSGPTRAPAAAFLVRSGLQSWIDANYESVMCTKEARIELLLRKGLASRPVLTPRMSDSVAMDAGLTALYRAGDLREAVACFRLVLARKPAHYGATFQLAKALDVAGLTADATVQWRRMLTLASAARDSATLAAVLARLR